MINMSTIGVAPLSDGWMSFPNKEAILSKSMKDQLMDFVHVN